MKKTSKIALSAVCAVAAFVTGCDLNSSDEGKKEVATYTEMPPCGGNYGTSGSDIEGAKLFVEDESALYACTDSGWVVESVTEYDLLPLCTEKGRKPTLGLSVYVQKDSASYRCLKTGWRLIDGTEDDSAEEPTPVLENRLVKGSVSAIGPFAADARVTLAEVYRDAASDSVLVSDSTYKGAVSMKLGKFVVPNVLSYSDYMALKVRGAFMDPLTGEVSASDSVTFEALVNINAEEIDVEVTDFMMYKRIVKLANDGYRIDDAIVRANKELFDVFGFTNVSDTDSAAAKLAIALLLRSNVEEGDFVEAINTFAEDFAEDGLYSDDEKLAQLGDFAFNIENLKIKDEESGELLIKESDYRKNLEAFGIKDAPAFEAYFTKYWVASYGLGGCGASRTNAVVKNANDMSDSASAFYTCDDAAWRVATDFERDTVSLGDARDGELKKGNLGEATYVFDTTGIGSGNATRWKEPDSIVLVIGSACTDEEKVKFTVKETKDEDDNEVYYACVDRNWAPSSETAFRIGRECSRSDKNVVEKYANADKKDSYARCHESWTVMAEDDTLFSYSWIPSDETNYKFRDKECALNDIFKDGDKYYVCDDEEDINFREVTSDDEIELGICSEDQKGAIRAYKAVKDSVYRVCQEDKYQAGKWSWTSTTKNTFKLQKICSASEDLDVLGNTTTVDGSTYKCGCLDLMGKNGYDLEACQYATTFDWYVQKEADPDDM